MDTSSKAPKKSLGQHWLDDEPSLNLICEIASISSDDTVLEIGPGQGYLTAFLVRLASQVVAVELDSALASSLKGRINSPNLTIFNQDVLSFDLTQLPPGYKIVANIPYYLTSKLIRTLSETSNNPALVVILVQKEVAERVAAKPGQMSLLSVTAQYYWQVSLDAILPAKLFVPPPKVDSQILILKPQSQLSLPEAETKKLFRLVKAGFAARRKTLLNSLAGGLRTDKPSVENVLASVGIESRIRPQELSLDQWIDLYRACAKDDLL